MRATRQAEHPLTARHVDALGLPSHVVKEEKVRLVVSSLREEKRGARVGWRGISPPEMHNTFQVYNMLEQTVRAWFFLPYNIRPTLRYTMQQYSSISEKRG